MVDNVTFIGPACLKNTYCSYYKNTDYKAFDKRYFQSIDGYNKLLKSIYFYRKFNNYTHILIAQTDTWIFGSAIDLLNFTGFDFSGAISYHLGEPYGFNGGLSLRNVQSSITALKSLRNYESPLEIWRRHFPGIKLLKPHKIISLLLDLTIRKKVHYRLNFFTKCNEDIFWSELVPKAVPNFNVISAEEAIKFSWEHNCEEFEKKHVLPFGCHGWWNYNYNFWEKIINLDEREN